MWYVCDVLYAVLYVCFSCFIVCGCSVSRRYVDVCYCDMFSVVNVYFDHLKCCVVGINSRMYVWCSECNVVSNECNVPTSCFVQPIGAHCCEVMLKTEQLPEETSKLQMGNKCTYNQNNSTGGMLFGRQIYNPSMVKI